MRDSSDVFSRVEVEQGRFLDELIELLRFPSISTDPQYAGDVRRCARYLVEQLDRIGFHTESLELGGHPLIYAQWLGAPGQPTVLVYGHYDVQPADPVAEWHHPPFEPRFDNGNLIARGATDDKAQLFCYLKAFEAMLAERGELPINVKLLFEGEEETDSESILRFVAQDSGDRLACDAVLISDSAMLGPGQPVLCYGLRGTAYVELEVEGPNRDLHSGEFGGAVANPLNALCKIIARLTDDDGRIAIPGFYDAVRPPPERERAELAQLPFDEAAYRADLGIDVVFGEKGYTTPERVTLRPTCDVNGLWGGYRGAGQKTVLPAGAGAKVSMRLVPDQDAGEIAELFDRYVQAIAPPGVRVASRLLGAGNAVLIDTDGEIAETVMRAMADVWGRRPVRTRGGGSVPVAGVFQDVLGAPVLLVGFGLPDDGAHSPNEKFALSQFYGGIRSVARILDRMRTG